MTTPNYSISLWKNPRGGVFYLNIRVLKPHSFKHRKTLNTKSDTEAKDALGYFRENEADKYVARLVSERAKEKRKSEDTTAPDRLDALMDWFTGTHLPYLGRADKTIRQYERVLRDFLIYCSSRHIGRVQQLSSRVIQEWQAWMARSRPDGEERPKRRDDLILLRHFLNEASEMNDIDVPRIRWNIPKKKTTSRFKALTEEELNDFLELVKTRRKSIYDVILWLSITGWRIGDVLDLRWTEVGEESINRTQLKTSSALNYPISPRMREILNRQSEDDDKVFPFEYYKFKKKVEQLCKTHYHRNVSPRDLRKTFGTLQAKRGCPPHLLRELMCHKSIEMTLHYYVESDIEGMAKELEGFEAGLSGQPGSTGADTL